MPTASGQTPSAAPTTLATAAEAEQLVTHLMEVMQTLRLLVQEETDLVRAGRVDRAVRLEKSKADLARRYAADIARCKANEAILVQTVPDKLLALHERHEELRALLQLNLTVLATAHAVSEGVIRGVASELSKKSWPQVYTASGRMRAARRNPQPLAVSRCL